VKKVSTAILSTAILGRGVTVLNSHPCGLIALEKPAGVLSHPNKAAERPRSLLTATYDSNEQCYSWADPAGEARKVWLLHRLDSATSGVVLVASDEAVARTVREGFEKRDVHKTYKAVVIGHSREKNAEWRDTLQVKNESGSVRAKEGGRLSAHASMRCVKLLPGPPAMSVLELEPHTGRTHQLRIQCSLRKLPIIGDKTYGNFRANRELARRLGTDRLFLHAAKISLDLRIGSARVKFFAESSLPEEFAAFVGGNRR
jgi:23S rRNA-/tRNA-specific pseudouridylate synthase